MSSLSKRKYEAHITFDIALRDLVVDIAERVGWTYSQIDGDPVLGKQVYCYLSAFDTDPNRLLVATHNTAEVAAMGGAKPMRLKVEEILYDSKTGVDWRNPCDVSSTERS